MLSLVVRIGENSDKKQPLCDKLATTVANIATDHVGFFLLSMAHISQDSFLFVNCIFMACDVFLWNLALGISLPS